jgi:glycosyltransferase involved in cell wall biosynthesis
MINGRRLVVVMPAYNAEKTLRRTYAEVPREYVDEVILVDDGSRDHTLEVARSLGIRTLAHPHNRGYGGNQKSCYTEALRRGADIVVMVHPDYQYSPRLIVAMASMIASGHYDAALGSRILGNDALAGGMPLYKYVANRALTFFQNLMLGAKLSEYHTGFRAFSRQVLEGLPLEENSDDFVFDNEMLAQVIYFGYQVGEISCPTRYMEDASSIGSWRAVRYGLGVVRVSVAFRLARWGLGSFGIFDRGGARLGKA